MKLLLKITVPAFLILASIGAGMIMEYYVQPLASFAEKQNHNTVSLDTDKLNNVWSLLNQKYVNPDSLNSRNALFGAIRGMVNAIGDPYTTFFDPQEAKLFLSDAEGSFEGIGAEIGVRRDLITIISPIHVTPADEAGLKAGDIILKIDEKPTASLGLDEAVSLIRGDKGTIVKLLIARDENDPFIKEIIRAQITIPSVALKMDGSIAYLQLFNFTQKSSEEFNAAALQLINNHAQGIILDLRNNPGGYLERSVDIAGWFLARESVVVIEEDKNQQRTYEKSKGSGRLKDIPMIILINEGSASAAEILAGALSDNLHVRLVGTNSFGKGSVQSLEELPDDSAVKITVAKWLTPNGASINDQGIKPDIEVKLTQEDEDEKKDPQFEKAKELLLESLKK